MLRAAFGAAVVAALLMAASGLDAAAAIPVSAPAQATQDSLRSIPPSVAGDTSATHPKAPSDSVLASKPKARSDSVIVVKHHFNHQEQIITGSVIMTCLALMMVAMNNYNPR